MSRIYLLLAKKPAGSRLRSVNAVLATVCALETARAAVTEAITALENEPGAGAAFPYADPPSIERLRVDALAEVATKCARVELPDLRDKWGVAPSDYLAHPELMTLSGPQRRELVQEQRYAVAKCTYEALREKLNKPDEYGITPDEYKDHPRLKLLDGIQRYPKLLEYQSSAKAEADEIEHNARRLKKARRDHQAAAARYHAVIAEHHSNALMDAQLDKPLPELIFGEQSKRIKSAVAAPRAGSLALEPGPDASPDASPDG